MKTPKNKLLTPSQLTAIKNAILSWIEIAATYETKEPTDFFRGKIKRVSYCECGRLTLELSCYQIFEPGTEKWVRFQRQPRQLVLENPLYSKNKNDHLRLATGGISCMIFKEFTHKGPLTNKRKPYKVA